jgi:hypothetical protein
MAGGSPMIKALSSMQGQTPSQGGAEYTPAQTRPTYTPAFSSQQTPQATPQTAPQQPVQGLQGLMSQMMARYQNPYQMQMRAPMPQYRNPALNYRPDMTMAQQSLSRVSPSVAEQQRVQAIEDARIAAEEATRGYE